MKIENKFPLTVPELITDLTIDQMPETVYKATHTIICRLTAITESMGRHIEELESLLNKLGQYNEHTSQH